VVGARRVLTGEAFMASRNMGLTGTFGSLFNGVVKEVEWVGVLGKVEVFEKEELVKAGMSLMSTCILIDQRKRTS
jgi:hypothetical protein